MFEELEVPVNLNKRYFIDDNNTYYYVIDSESKFEYNKSYYINKCVVIDDHRIVLDECDLIVELFLKDLKEITKEEFIELYKKVSNEILNNIAGLL